MRPLRRAGRCVPLRGGRVSTPCGWDCGQMKHKPGEHCPRCQHLGGDGSLTCGCGAAEKGVTVYAADRSGNSWTVSALDGPGAYSEALAVLARDRREHPHWHLGVYWTDDPEHGDIEDELEEAAV